MNWGQGGQGVADPFAWGLIKRVADPASRGGGSWWPTSRPSTLRELIRVELRLPCCGHQNSSASLLITQSAPMAAACVPFGHPHGLIVGLSRFLKQRQLAPPFEPLQDFQTAVHRAVVGGDDSVHPWATVPNMLRMSPSLQQCEHQHLCCPLLFGLELKLRAWAHTSVIPVHLRCEVG